LVGRVYVVLDGNRQPVKCTTARTIGELCVECSRGVQRAFVMDVRKRVDLRIEFVDGLQRAGHQLGAGDSSGLDLTA
jgi:hypothetical protein